MKLFLHLRAVALPLAPGRAFVEAVSVGIDQDAGGLAIDSSDQHLPQVLILLRQGDEGVNLRRGVTQPHGVNISGDHERIRLAVYHLELTGRVQGIRVAVLEHPSQLRVLDTGLGSLQLLLYRLGGKLTGLGSRALAGVIAGHLRGDRAKTLLLSGVLTAEYTFSPTNRPAKEIDPVFRKLRLVVIYIVFMVLYSSGKVKKKIKAPNPFRTGAFANSIIP